MHSIGVQATSGSFLAGVGRIWLDRVACTGRENRLVDCPANPVNIHSCNHDQDAGIICPVERKCYHSCMSGHFSKKDNYPSMCIAMAGLFKELQSHYSFTLQFKLALESCSLNLIHGNNILVLASYVLCVIYPLILTFTLHCKN